jgi:hypothetical protein
LAHIENKLAQAWYQEIYGRKKILVATLSEDHRNAFKPLADSDANEVNTHPAALFASSTKGQ